MSPGVMNTKIPLPEFLKVLSSNGVPVKKAMEMTGKIYKTYNTPAALSQLNDSKLEELGISDKEGRKLFTAALSKAGYTNKPSPISKKIVLSPEAGEIPLKKTSPSTASSHPTPITTPSKSAKRKRKAQDGGNEFLPNASDEGEEEGTWDFKEVLDDNVLKLKSCVINRAPVMMAWSMQVAEKMHFLRAEALSIASVYTEMNAVSKGVSLGIYKADEECGREARVEGSQPYVELIGRRPLYRTKKDQWRALSSGVPVPPNAAFQYITRSFRQTTPFLIGALKLLADSYTSQELNKKAWAFYADFRPEVNEWGKRSEIRCSRILDLRKGLPSTPALTCQDSVPQILYDSPMLEHGDQEPQAKKMKSLTVDETEASASSQDLAK